jgi:hypothetical protein
LSIALLLYSDLWEGGLQPGLAIETNVLSVERLKAVGVSRQKIFVVEDSSITTDKESDSSRLESEVEGFGTVA